MTTTDSDAVSLFRRATMHAAHLLSRVRPDQLALSTPCSEWNVQALIDHMVGGPRYLLAAMAGTPPAPVCAATLADYQHAVEQALVGLRDAETLTRECTSPLGFSWTVEQAVAGTFMDQLVHTWDLAVATGQDRTLDPILVDRCLEMFFPQMPEMGRSAGLIGPAVAVPDDASPQDRMLGALGRQP